MMAQTYLLRGRQWVREPAVRRGIWALAYGSAGFFLSAAGLHGSFQPLSSALVLGMTGWRGILTMLGSMAGYRLFWGREGMQGVLWSALSGLTALAVGRQKWFRGLLIPLISAAIVSASGLLFQVAWGAETGLSLYFLRVILGAASALLWHRVLCRREPLTDWIAGAVGVLALAEVMPVPGLGLGYGAAALMAVTGSFPAAVMAGLALDLANVTAVPMGAALCAAYFLRALPGENLWFRYGGPALAALAVMALGGTWDILPLPGLLLGGALGILVPPRPETAYHRGPTGAAQVRLELGADVMARYRGMLLEHREPDIDREALLEKARQRACDGCPYRSGCGVKDRLAPELLGEPLTVTCRKTARLREELQRSQEQLRTLEAQRCRRQEYRQAMLQQYGFLAGYLHHLADQLPRSRSSGMPAFRIQVSVRTRNKEAENGDRCLAFPGPGCRYYVLLCDGMGTGPGAAGESRSAGNLLKQMLTAGFPADHCLRTVNSLLTLRGQAGAVTVDLAEVGLDTGKAVLYKWGAAPSWLLKMRGAEKIGTATPPPGISVTEDRELVTKLSLRGGEVLILFSDGVDGEGALRRMDLAPDAPPGELAETLLERGSGKGEDDATAVVIRLRSLHHDIMPNLQNLSKHKMWDGKLQKETTCCFHRIHPQPVDKSVDHVNK